jgi:hypothetical protein
MLSTVTVLLTTSIFILIIHYDQPCTTIFFIVANYNKHRILKHQMSYEIQYSLRHLESKLVKMICDSIFLDSLLKNEKDFALYFDI